MRGLTMRLWLACLLAIPFAHALHADQNRTLTGGWSAWPPFSYVDTRQGIQQWHGLDVEMLNAVAKEAGYTIDASAVPWDQHLRDIESGARDIAVGASRTPQREEYAMFSAPFRFETMVLVVPRGRAVRFPPARRRNSSPRSGKPASASAPARERPIPAKPFRTF